MSKQTPPPKPPDSGEEQAGTLIGVPEADQERERRFAEWAKRYQAEGRREVGKMLRFTVEEWERIDKRASRANLPVATYMRLRVFGEDPDEGGLGSAMARYCAVGQRILDLIIKNPAAVGHLAEAIRLRDELEALHRDYCFHRRGDYYEAPPGIEAE